MCLFDLPRFWPTLWKFVSQIELNIRQLYVQDELSWMRLMVWGA